MSNFAKYSGQSTHGWDEKAFLQTIRLGGNAEIALWGGGPGGVDLEVSAQDPSVCTVHERPRPATPDWRVFLLTALRLGQTEVRAILPGTANLWATSVGINVTLTHAGIRLVFFPGERISGAMTLGSIYAVGTGDRFNAAGGSPVGFKDRGGHTSEPTPPGHYTLGPKRHVTTASWPMSVIPFGAQLRLTSSGEVEYKGDSGPWSVATGPKGAVTLAQFSFLHRDHLRPNLNDVVVQVRNIFVDPVTGALRNTIWEKNDFGRWGWNLRRDGHATAYFIHTTPEDEQATTTGKAVFLANSHGCIHLVPAERDRMIAAGYLKEGVDFEVRPYNESGPP